MGTVIGLFDDVVENDASTDHSERNARTHDTPLFPASETRKGSAAPRHRAGERSLFAGEPERKRPDSVAVFSPLPFASSASPEDTQPPANAAPAPTPAIHRGSRRRRWRGVIAVVIVIGILAGLGVTWALVSRPSSDGLDQLRDIERSIRSTELSLTRATTDARAAATSANEASLAAQTASTSVTGLIDASLTTNLTNAASALDSAAQAIEALDDVQPYERSLVADPTPEQIAAAVAVAQDASAQATAALDAMTAASAKLTMRSESLDVAVDGVSAATIEAADAALAKPEPADGDPLRAALIGPLEQLRGYPTHGVVRAVFLPEVAEPLRALTTRQSELEQEAAEEAERSATEQETRRSQTTAPSREPSTPAPATPVPTEPTPTEPAEPTPTEPAEPTPTEPAEPTPSPEPSVEQPTG